MYLIMYNMTINNNHDENRILANDISIDFEIC